MTKKEYEKRMRELRGKISEAKSNEELDRLEMEKRKLEMEGYEEEVKSNVVDITAEEERKLVRESETNEVEKRNLVKVDVLKEERKSEEEINKDNVLASKEYRTAWAKSLLCRNDLNEQEKRALGVALTTTATEFVAPTTDVDGINNGGLFIPESVTLEILKELELESPFLADAAISNIRGLLTFPYKKSGSGAEWKKEGEDNNDESDEFGSIRLTQKELSKTIRITWKLEAMAVEEFINYMISEIAKEMREELAESSIYGAGGDDITGATIGAINADYTEEVLDGIVAAIKKLPKRKRIGAKIYLADDTVTDIAFAKDEQGRYQFPILNGGGLTKIGKYQVAADPFLKEGEFIIGNAGRYYRLNFNEPISVAKDSYGKQRINDYTGYTVVGGAPIPNSFVYGKKTV